MKLTMVVLGMLCAILNMVTFAQAPVGTGWGSLVWAVVGLGVVFYAITD